MKNCLLVILLCTAWWLRGAEFSFKQVRPKRAEAQNACMLHIEEDGVERFLGTLGVDSPQPVPVSLVKLSVDENGLNVDTRELFEKHPSVRGVTLVFINFIAPGEIVRNAPGRESAERINRLELTASTDSDGLEAAMFYSGQAAGEHWWRVERKALGRQSATYAFDQFLPDSLTVLHFRVDLQSPGVYHLQKAAFRTAAVEKRKYDSSVNQILNGGAERGLCDTSAVKRENIASVFDGKVRNWRGECIESDMHIDTDGENAYAGAYSFRMRRDTVAEVLGELRFNPVPAEEGAPVSFSFHARADRPVNAGVAFYVASACAIVKQIQVGIQWRKYELFVPSWGEKNEDFAVLGEITGNPLAPGSVIPCIALYSEGTMWVDNAAAAIGGHAEFDAHERVYLSHRLDHADSCYYAGEPAVASLTVNNVSETPLKGRISWQVLNSFGDELASGVGAELSLGAKSRQTLTQAVALPEQLRGASNLVFRFSSYGGQAESSAYFGVVDRCETPGRHLGVEVPSANNPKRMIPWLKKFRIGMIRVGCASGSLENAFRNTPFYAAAGIRILLNASMSDAAARDPEVYAGELRDMKGYLNEYGRYIEVIEAKNEPNLSPGWDVGMNLKTIRELYALRQELGLKFRLAGPATCERTFRGLTICWRSVRPTILM